MGFESICNKKIDVLRSILIGGFASIPIILLLFLERRKIAVEIREV